MPARQPSDLRNVLLCGPSGSGKTSIAERLLFVAGVLKRPGTVAEGTTVSDHLPEERSHGHSLQPSVMHLEHERHLVNLIDTPGLPDFIGHAIACFPACETVAVTLDATRGIDGVARRLMAVAQERRIPRMIIVNKIDEAGDGELEALLASIRSTFGTICLPINLPSLRGRKVINVFEHDGTDAQGDQTDFMSVHEAHKAIVEQVIEVDDDLTTQYLEAGEGKFDPARLHAAFEQALEEAHLVPVCFMSARTGVGAEDLLHVFASLCPSPLEVNPPEFVYRAAEGEPEQDWHSHPDHDGRLLAHVFRVAGDPFLGRVGIVRVHQGTLKARHDVFIDDQKKSVRLGHLFLLQGKEHVEVAEAGPGSIVAMAKVEDLRFNAVLHDSHDYDSVRLRPLPLPRPVYGLAVRLKSHADEAKFSAAAHRFMMEDPCLIVERIAATGETVMRGLGELHLRVVVERFRSVAHVELDVAPPKVAYKETITARAEGHHRHKKQTGGAGQFGEVFLRVEPLPADHPDGFEFVNDTVGGSIPRQYIPAIEKGVRQVLAQGAVAGYPLHGVRVSVYDGKHHDVDSKEIAFITAGRRAFIDAVGKARPALMEPYVSLEIAAPARCMGDVAGQLSTKRGRVQGTDVVGGDQCVVRAVAPLSELQNYAGELKSITGGAGSFAMEYSHDERTPPQVQAAVIAAYKPQAEPD